MQRDYPKEAEYRPGKFQGEGLCSDMSSLRVGLGWEAGRKVVSTKMKGKGVCAHVCWPGEMDA